MRWYVKYNPDFVIAFFRQSHGGLTPTPEYQFAKSIGRKWRFDFAWEGEYQGKEYKIALEIQGGLFVGGRHVRGSGLVKEHEKLSTAAIMGWRILYCQPRDLLTTKTADMVWAAITGRIE